MRTLAALLTVAFVAPTALGASGPALGTSAAIDRGGRVLIVYREAAGEHARVIMQRSADRGATWSSPIRVTATPEPVSADGENRPKIVVGPKGELYVSWTSPTSANYTGDIRFARSLDGGGTWSSPLVIHKNRELITHRFESLQVDGAGRLWAVWVDKRDLEQAQARGGKYAGAALYYAYSTDRGQSWQGDFKLADHSCECCRIALTLDAKGRAVAMWRHVFDGNERDHASAVLEPDRAPTIQRVTFDRWRVDACPHHGPSIAHESGGTRHAVWFDQVGQQGRVFYGRLSDSGPVGVQALPVGAAHADLALAGHTIAVAWKRFDGTSTRIESMLSRDGGLHFEAGPGASTTMDSDQPRVLAAGNDLLLVWRQADRVSVVPLATAARSKPDLRTFTKDSMREIEQRRRGRGFWVVLWDLECPYCMQSLRHLAEAQKADPSLDAVTITTDSIAEQDAIRTRLHQLGVRSEAYAFAALPAEGLRYTIDPDWIGEKPRAYRYAIDGTRESAGAGGRSHIRGRTAESENRC
jgi:hypothetical protein